MNSTAARFLKKAQKLLFNASIALGVGLNEDAGRNAYLSGYNAARAFLYEREEKLFKTHNGVQAEFSRIAKDDSHFDTEMRSFLSKTYNLKKIADYEEGPEAEITAERAASAIEKGKRFLRCCEEAMDSSRDDKRQ